MTAVIPAEGAFLERVLDATCRTSHSGLNRQAYGKFHAARTKTSWGSRYQRTFALVDGNDILASADRYDLAAVFDGRALRVCGVPRDDPRAVSGYTGICPDKKRPAAALAPCGVNRRGVASVARVC